MSIRSFLARKPAYRNIPFQIRRERVITLAESITIPRWTDEDLWTLTEAYYSKLKGIIKTRSGIILTVQEVLDHIRRRTDIGKWLMETHAQFLQSIVDELGG